jgi:transcriptional regulator with XRE-family HTH domain
MANYAGDNLRRLMATLGLSIEQVIATSRLNRRTVQRILDGSHKPHSRTLHRLAAALGVSASELFVDPAQLVYRQFDRQTNPMVEEAIERQPALFADWTEADFDELHSRVGAGGPLTIEGALQAVRAMNDNREAHEKLSLLLESSQAELIREILRVMYQKVTVEAAP